MRVPATEPDANIRRAGEDIAAGDLVLPRRHGADARRDRRGRVGRAAARSRAPAARGSPLLVTGDELTEPGRAARAPAASTARTATRWPGRSSAGGRRAGRERAGGRQRGRHARGARRARSTAADVVVVSGGVSVGPARPRQGRARGARRRGALLGRAAASRQADLVRHARRHARLRPARQPGLGDGDLPAVRRGRPWRRSRAPTRPPPAPPPRSTSRSRATGRREQAVRVRLSGRRGRLARRAHQGRPGLARADVDARRRRRWR